MNQQDRDEIIKGLSGLSKSDYFCTRQQIINFMKIAPSTFHDRFRDVETTNGDYCISEVAEHILKTGGLKK